MSKNLISIHIQNIATGKWMQMTSDFMHGKAENGMRKLFPKWCFSDCSLRLKKCKERRLPFSSMLEKINYVASSYIWVNVKVFNFPIV